MLTVSKPASLVQQKKQQWAREREEMSHLYLPWGSGNDRYTERLQVRNQFASSLELHKQSSYDYQEPVSRQRSPSLPPIRNQTDQIQGLKEDSRRNKDTLNRNIPSSKRFSFYDEDGEGDTSGYASETVNMSIKSQCVASLDDNSRNTVVAWQQESVGKRGKQQSNEMLNNEGVWSARTPRGSLSTEEGRARWGDRGVATGRLWEPTAPTARLPQMQNQKAGTPSWVERGLNMIENTAEILVIDERSSGTSGLECDRTSCNGSDEGRTYLRGQNVPIEPEIKAQRENKRIKALELQSAILSQLEDREKRRQEEREIKLREEKLEELRILREQEEDRLKLEEERRKNEARQQLENRKLETLKKALEDAEKKARQEKEKRFISHKQNPKINSITDKPQSPKRENPANNYEDNLNREKENIVSSSKTSSPKRTNRTYDIHSAQSQIYKNKDNSSQQTTEFNSPRSIGTGNLNFFIQNVPPLSLTENQFNIVPIGINGELVNSQQNGLQLAVLVPQNINNNLYSLSLNSLNNIQENMESSAKVLTPRKFRNGRYKDASTQTDINLFRNTIDKGNETENNERHLDKDYQNIDENAPQSHHNILKKDRRLRSEERFKKDLESRPKWGVNRPAAQYKKQSEKDPFYSQKRKIRPKHRPQPRQYLSQSSDDSRSPSPPIKSENISEDLKQRNSLSQSYWKNKRNSQEYLKPCSDRVPEDNIDSQPDCNNLNQLNSKKSPINSKLSSSPTKRMTLSQKFINDKYGNRKLWNDDIITERHYKANTFDVESRKKIIEQIKAKRDYLDQFDDHDIVMKTKT